MAPRVYLDPAVNEFTFFFQISATILTYFFNCTLIFIVQRSKNKEIGTYRILITFFALSDIYYNTVHCIVYPIPENYGNVFMIGGHGFYREQLGAGLYMGAYGHAFPILIFHFLYRLFAIKYPRYLAYFPLFLLALFLCTLASNGIWFTVFYWCFHPDKQILRVLTPLHNGTIYLPMIHNLDYAEKYSQALYWTKGTFDGPRWRNLIGAGVIFSSMASTYITIVCCTYLISKYLKVTSKSAQSIRLHKQLFRSLIYQSFVPLFTAYAPAGSAVLLPVFGLPLVPISIICPFACVTHPLFDSLLLILTISEYRQAFFSLIGLSICTRTIGLQSPRASTMTEFTRSSVAPLAGN